MKDYTEIQIKNLEVYAKIGCYDWEKFINQKLIINITICLSQTNDFLKIEDTVDYDNLTKKIIDFIKNTSCELLEKLAKELCEYILNTDFKIVECTVKISKPMAINFETRVYVKHRHKRE